MKYFYSVFRSNIFSAFFICAVILFSSKPASSQTLFSQDWESGIGTWYADNGVWEVGVPTSGPDSTHSGINCAGTILNGNYTANDNTRLISPSIVLPNVSGNESIQLKFWQWFVTQNGYDQGQLQISVNSGPWETISAVNFDGLNPAWTQYVADLTVYAGSTIRIAFYFTSNFDNAVYAGWFIDDVSIEKKVVNFSNPEDFELGVGDWSVDNGLWEVGVPKVGPDSAYSGQYCAGTILNGNYFANANTRLISPKITLIPATGQTPMLFFYQWFSMQNNYDQGLVQISVNDNRWQTISNAITGNSFAWSQYGLDLSNFADSTVRIAFYFTSNSDNAVYTGWYIDDIRIQGVEIPTAVKNDNSITPNEFVLQQNYPNPFNPTTKIKYGIPKTSFVTLKVYDVLGNEIATLVNEKKPAGSYEVDFNGSRLASGVYFYSLQSGDFIETKKMLILK